MSDAQVDLGGLVIERTAPAGSVDIGGQGTLRVNAKLADILQLQASGVQVASVDQNGKLQVAAGQGIDTATAGTLNLGGANASLVNIANGVITITPGGFLNFGTGLTSLGGGAAPTFGTIGGTGPATAAQNAWQRINIAGTATWIPVWR